MSSIKIKAFFDHKRGISHRNGADRIAMNLEKGRFAVADGVSHSFLPNLWAEILCESFVTSDIDANEDWIGIYSVSQLNEDCQLWQNRVEETLKKAQEKEAFILMMSKDEYGFAGSTLVGIAVKDNCLFYNILGDSCLFIYDNGTKSVTPYTTVDEQSGFNNRPNYFFSAGKVVGQWIHGSVPLKSGYVMLMTDKISEWFIKEYSENPDIIEQLWAIGSHEKFLEMVENARETGSMKDDDVALMMLQVDIGYEVMHCDTLETLIASQESTDNEKNSVAVMKQEDNSIAENNNSDVESNEKPQEQITTENSNEGIVMPVETSDLASAEISKCQDELEESKHDESKDDSSIENECEESCPGCGKQNSSVDSPTNNQCEQTWKIRNLFRAMKQSIKCMQNGS